MTTFNINNRGYIIHWFWRPHAWTWRWWRTSAGNGGPITMMDLGPLRLSIIWDNIAARSYAKEQYGLD